MTSELTLEKLKEFISELANESEKYKNIEKHLNESNRWYSFYSHAKNGNVTSKTRLKGLLRLLN